jgi:hypothetical protein
VQATYRQAQGALSEQLVETGSHAELLGRGGAYAVQWQSWKGE